MVMQPVVNAEFEQVSSKSHAGLCPRSETKLLSAPPHFRSREVASQASHAGRKAVVVFGFAGSRCGIARQRV